MNRKKKIDITYAEKFGKKNFIDKDNIVKIISERDDVDEITMEQRGLAQVGEDTFVFLQVTVYFKKDK